MKSGVTDVRAFDPSTDLADALATVRAGGVLVYPTETVYGFGGSLDPDSVRAVMGLKGRTDKKPLLVLVPGIRSVEGLAWTEAARELARVFWPGAVTLVLRDPERLFPDGVRSPRGTVAVRHSSHPVAAALVEHLAAPLTSTSANAPGQPPAVSGAAALAAARAAGPEVPIHLLDAGTLPPAPPSTIVDCTGETPRVIREGATPASRLRCVLPHLTDG